MKKRISLEKSFKWSACPPQSNVWTRAHNIVSHLPGVTGPAKALGTTCTEVHAWECLITTEVLEVILRTNEKLQSTSHNFTDSKKYIVKDTNIRKLRAFIGLLFYSAIFKSNDDVNSIFATDGTGTEIFRCTISQQRFLVLLATLRFDNAKTREEYKTANRTAEISWIFEQFVENCKKNYSISQYACIYEKLFRFRGKWPFHMYMPNKPWKYGIKIVAIND